MNTPNRHRAAALLLAVLTTLSLLAGLDQLATSEHGTAPEGDAGATQWLVTRTAAAQG